MFVAVATSEFLVGTRATVALTPRANENPGGALHADLTVGSARLRVGQRRGAAALLTKSAAAGARRGFRRDAARCAARDGGAGLGGREGYGM